MKIAYKILILTIILRTSLEEVEVEAEKVPNESETLTYKILNTLNSMNSMNSSLREYKLGNDTEDGIICLNSLEKMALSPSSPEFMNFLTYSGKGAHDLGDFPGCRDTETSRYILVNAMVILNVGLCVPKTCSARIFTGVIYYIAESMGSPLPVGLFFVDPQLNNQTLGTVSYGSATIIAILAFLTLIVILSGKLDIHQKTRFEEIIVFFSIASNAKALIYAKNRIDPNLDIFHGVRFLSISWVIFGHSFFTFVEMPVNNINSLFSSVQDDFGFSLITAATLSVDTFFLLSGFFSILGVWKEVGKPGGKAINILKCYLHRYIRLLPLYTIIILISIYIMPLFAFGPANYLTDLIANTCKDKWWWNLLYINNFQPMAEECLGWTWYLANDMQMFLLAPILVYIYCIRPIWGIISWGILAATSSILQIVFIAKDNWMVNMLSPQAAPDAYYQKPWMRINPYLVGIMGAWIYLAFKEGEKAENEGKEPGLGYLHPALFRSFTFKIRSSSFVRYLLYILGFALTFLAVFLMFPFVHYSVTDTAANIFFLWLYRPVFVFGLMLVMFPVLVGHGRPLLATLGAPFLAPLGRMTYGVYMIHLMIFFYLIGIQFTAQYYSFHMVFFWTLRIIFLSYLISLFLTLVVEAPIMRIEQWLLRGQFIRKKKEEVKYTVIKEAKDEESKFETDLNINDSEIKPK